MTSYNKSIFICTSRCVIGISILFIILFRWINCYWHTGLKSNYFLVSKVPFQGSWWTHTKLRFRHEQRFQIKTILKIIFSNCGQFCYYRQYLEWNSQERPGKKVNPLFPIKRPINWLLPIQSRRFSPLGYPEYIYRAYLELVLFVASLSTIELMIISSLTLTFYLSILIKTIKNESFHKNN